MNATNTYTGGIGTAYCSMPTYMYFILHADGTHTNLFDLFDLERSYIPKEGDRLVAAGSGGAGDGGWIGANVDKRVLSIDLKETEVIKKALALFIEHEYSNVQPTDEGTRSHTEAQTIAIEIYRRLEGNKYES